jgi:hypothetical protein
VSDAIPPVPIRVVPQSRTRAQLAEAPAKLVSTLLSVTTAGLLDAGRFRRGREYASSGAVTELVVSPGTLHGTVMGSRREPYAVEVHTDIVAAPASGTASVQGLTAITPDADDLHAMCTCPDGMETTCKHAAAVLLAFAEEAGDRPELLVAWRCGAGAPVARATIGSRLRETPSAPSSDRASVTGIAGRVGVGVGHQAGRVGGRAAGVAPSPFATPAWLDFVDFPTALPAVDEPLDPSTADDGPADRTSPATGLVSERLGLFDLAAMVRSAQQAMRAASNDII